MELVEQTEVVEVGKLEEKKTKCLLTGNGK